MSSLYGRIPRTGVPTTFVGTTVTTKVAGTTVPASVVGTAVPASVVETTAIARVAPTRFVETAVPTTIVETAYYWKSCILGWCQNKMKLIGLTSLSHCFSFHSIYFS